MSRNDRITRFLLSLSCFPPVNLIKPNHECGELVKAFIPDLFETTAAHPVLDRNDLARIAAEEEIFGIDSFQ